VIGRLAPLLDEVEVLAVDRLRHVVTPGFKRVRVRCSLHQAALACAGD
jgi:hypothetical protein